MAVESTYMSSAVPSDVDRIRFLINDVDPASWVFTDAEISMVLALEAGYVKLAAAQIIDTNADNEALASKVLRTQDLQTDGAKLADALHKRAAALRQQHADEVDGDGSFEIIEMTDGCGPEHTIRWFG